MIVKSELLRITQAHCDELQSATILLTAKDTARVGVDELLTFLAFDVETAVANAGVDPARQVP